MIWIFFVVQKSIGFRPLNSYDILHILLSSIRCTEYEGKLRESEIQRESMDNLKAALSSKEREINLLQEETAKELDALRVDANAMKQSQMASLEKQTQLISGMHTRCSLVLCSRSILRTF